MIPFQLENHLDNECTKYEITCPLNCSDFQVWEAGP